jgi:hypothetical protein
MLRHARAAKRPKRNDAARQDISASKCRRYCQCGVHLILFHLRCLLSKVFIIALDAGQFMGRRGRGHGGKAWHFTILLSRHVMLSPASHNLQPCGRDGVGSHVLKSAVGCRTKDAERIREPRGLLTVMSCSTTHERTVPPLSSLNRRSCDFFELRSSTSGAAMAMLMVSSVC